MRTIVAFDSDQGANTLHSHRRGSEASSTLKSHARVPSFEKTACTPKGTVSQQKTIPDVPNARLPRVGQDRVVVCGELRVDTWRFSFRWSAISDAGSLCGNCNSIQTTLDWRFPLFFFLFKPKIRLLSVCVEAVLDFRYFLVSHFVFSAQSDGQIAFH